MSALERWSSGDDRRLARQLEAIDQQHILRRHDTSRALQRRAADASEAMGLTMGLVDRAMELAGGDMQRAAIVAPIVSDFVDDARAIVRGRLF